MPRPTRAHGRPGTPTMPASWAASHRPVLDGTRRAAISVRADATTQTWDDEGQEMVSTPALPHFTGTCRVQALGNQARTRIAVGDPETTADYLITTDVTDTNADAQPAEQQLATVTGTGDPLLDGRTLRIVQVSRGTDLFERYLFATLDD